MTEALIGGLAGTIVTALLAWLLHQRSEHRERREELRGLIAKLLEIREDFTLRVLKIADVEEREVAGAFCNTKKNLFLQTADAVVDRISGQVSSAEYGLLAQEHVANSSFGKAEEYFKRAVKAAATKMDQVTARQAAGSFYFTPGPLRDFDNGREHFEKALAVNKNPSDPYTAYSIGFTYETWALWELSNGFAAEGEKLLERARKYYHDLPAGLDLRTVALARIDAKADFARRNAGVAPQPP